METPIGLLPPKGAIPVDGMGLAEEAMEELLRVDVDGWRQELPSIQAHFDALGDRLPSELLDELAELEKRLG